MHASCCNCSMGLHLEDAKLQYIFFRMEFYLDPFQHAFPKPMQTEGNQTRDSGITFADQDWGQHLSSFYANIKKCASQNTFESEASNMVCKYQQT